MRGLKAYVILLFLLNLFPVVPASPVANGDKVVHLIEFLLLGVLGGRAWLVVFPILLEVLQLAVPGRTFSLHDMAANLIGFAVGYGIWRVRNEGGD
ncbi:VanZ family protein [Palaeococcus ferrophilus]|uniref:VanZ family protein n=1 Tax=Palaeococcus ferrophilus TaxID=83868 RepID=UPI00064FA831|nr:VanZ family protein [Palaeococcus ferrophilus]